MMRPIELATKDSLAREIFRARVLDAEISARLSCCPPPTADNLRWFRERVRRSVRTMQLLEVELERRNAS